MDIASQHKQRELRALLERGVVMMHLDPRIEGVVVPPQFSREAALRLNVAYAFNLPAFEITDEGIYAILSFNRQNFGCTIPWTSIYALTLPDESHEGMVWPDSMPLELKEAESSDAARDDAEAAQPEPVFAVLPGGRESEEEQLQAEDLAVTKRETSRSHLTLIKS